MASGSFAHNALIDLAPSDLTRMLTLDESLFVEHKSGVGEESAHGLVKAVGSFANTLGGWVLLGVQGGKPLAEPPDWSRQASPPLVDFVRDRLRGELDPLPAFEAKVIDLEDSSIGVVRVYESSDTPHVAVSSGAVYVREVAGSVDASRPRKPGSGARSERIYRATQIRSSAQLRELSVRGKAAEERVRALVDSRQPLPLIGAHLPLDFEQTTTGIFQPAFSERAAVVVRLAPLTLTPRFREWTTTADGAAALLGAGESLARVRGLANNWVEPDPSGAALHVPLDQGALHSNAAGGGLSAKAHLVLDGAGVVGTALEIGSPEDQEDRAWIRLDALARDFIKPVIAAACKVLVSGEFLGRAHCQIDLMRLPRAFLLEEAGNQGGRMWVPSSGDLMLPAEEGEIDQLAQRVANALGRSAGIPAWDAPR